MFVGEFRIANERMNFVGQTQSRRTGVSDPSYPFDKMQVPLCIVKKETKTVQVRACMQFDSFDLNDSNSRVVPGEEPVVCSSFLLAFFKMDLYR